MKLVERFTKRQKLLLIIAIVLLVLLFIYTGIALFFGSHFGFRTTVNGVKASGKSVKQIEKLIEKEIEGYTLTLEEREDKTEVLKGTEITLKPLFDDSLREEMKKQNGFAWPVYLFKIGRAHV